VVIEVLAVVLGHVAFGKGKDRDTWYATAVAATHVGFEGSEDVPVSSFWVTIKCRGLFSAPRP